MSTPKSTRMQLYWNTLVRIPVRVASISISIIVARILEPRDYGILTIAMMLIGYANIFTNFGLNEAIVQKQISDGRTVNSIFTFDLTVSALIGTGSFLAADLVAVFFSTPESAQAIRILCLVFIVTSFIGVPHAILRRDMNFKAISLIEALQSGLMSGLTLLLAVMGWGYWSLVYGQLIPLVVVAILLCVKANWVPRIYFNNSLMKQVYDFGIWNFLKMQLDFISMHIDKFISGRWLGPVDLGLYDKSKSLAGIPYDSFLANINAVMFSSFSRSKEKRAQLQQEFNKSLTLNSIIIFPTYMGSILVAPYFVHGFLGERWTAMTVPFQIVLFGFIFRTLTGLVTSFNIATGSYRGHSLRFLVSVVIFSIACVTLVRFGLNGIAFSLVIFNSVSFVLSTLLAIQQHNIPWSTISNAILSGFIPASVMGLCVEAASHSFLTTYTLSNFFLLSVIGVTVYLSCLLCSRNETVKELRLATLTDVKKKMSSLSG